MNKEKRHTIFNILSILIGVAGLVFSAISLKLEFIRSITNDNLLLSLLGVIVFVVIALLVLVYLYITCRNKAFAQVVKSKDEASTHIAESMYVKDMYCKLDSEKKKIEIDKGYIEKNRNRIAMRSHRIIHKTRDLIDIFYTDILTFYNTNEIREYSVYSDLYKNHLKQVFLKNINQIFTAHTGDAKCRSCIKFIVPEDENPKSIQIRTFLRDSDIDIPKEVIDLDDQWHTLDSDNVVINKFTDNVDAKFHCNDLNTEYPGFNLSVRSYREALKYNAIVIVPLRAPVEAAKEGTPKKIPLGKGMVVVTNTEGQFDEELSYNLLAAMTDSVYHLFILMDEIDKIINKSLDQEAVKNNNGDE